ncbi:MAG: hypothetical protein MMC33_003954 [Icmadophila ericetorum]|nr:hypothetical protein [Icmadophila ericetorum]
MFGANPEHSHSNGLHARSSITFLPLQQSVSSASQMPAFPSTRISPSSHTASAQYVEQYRTFMEHQRQVHNEERALWHLERAELHGKIGELEAIVRSYRLQYGSTVSSPPAETHTAGSYGSHSASIRSHVSTGDEYWRGAGGKSDAQSTRTFSQSSNDSKTDERRMPSIVEEGEKTVTLREKQAMEIIGSSKNGKQDRACSIDGSKIDKNLDGISFKFKALAPSIVKGVTILQSPSPLTCDSPARASPGSIVLPSSTLLAADDPYTRDAGHTPLVRHVAQDDGSTISESLTPTQPEQELPPLEPRSTVRPPNERSDSYFPPAPEINREPPATTVEDDDPELKPPLTLRNFNDKEDKSFLSELDAKLLQAACSSAFLLEAEKSPTGEAEKSGLDKENAPAGDDEDDGNKSEPEPEIKLRIKRSMNFGSAFGSSRCGKI